MTCDRTLAEICELIVDCPHKTAPESELGYAYAVGTKAIRGGRINFDQARSVSEETYEQWVARAAPKPGDLILCREAPVGPVARVPPSPRVCLGQRTVLLRADEELADPRYLFQMLSAPMTQARLRVLSEGSTVAHLNVADVRNFTVTLPPMGEQRRIAGVLGALDAKIEAERALVERLNEVGSVWFNECFGSLADRPRVALDTIVSVHKATVQPASTPDEIFEHFSIPAFDDGMLPFTEDGRAMLSGKTRLPDSDCILFSKLNPATRRVWWPAPSGLGTPVCSPEFVVLTPSPKIHASFVCRCP